MKGLIFIVLIYLGILVICIIAKIVYFYFTSVNKKGSETTTPKIYYITPNKSKKTEKNATIPLKETVIKKQKD
jgi:flagellar basal body-associated protein FliL